MPARIHKIRHDENTRQKIRVAKLLSLLDAHAHGERPMESSQIKAIEILLSKALPSLQSVEISGEITTSKVIRTPKVETDVDTWQKQYADQPRKELN